MTERRRAGVGHAGHFEHSRQMRVAGLPLNAVGHVEDDAGRPARRIGGHEFLKAPGPVLVGLAKQDLMARRLESLDGALDGRTSVLLGARRAKMIDDAGMIGITDDGYFHGPLRIQGAVARRQSSETGVPGDAEIPAATDIAPGADRTASGFHPSRSRRSKHLLISRMPPACSNSSSGRTRKSAMAPSSAAPAIV